VSCGNVKASTLQKLRISIHNCEKDCPPQASLTRSRVRFFLDYWLKKIPAQQLEFQLLNFGTQNWKFICDLLHPNPKHFECKYFQEFIYNYRQPQSQSQSQTNNRKNSNKNKKSSAKKNRNKNSQNSRKQTRMNKTKKKTCKK
jgi:hypothetical protein